MVKIQRLPNGQLVVTIPKRLAELKNWGKGTEITFRDHSQDSFIIIASKEAESEKKEENAKKK